MWRSRCRHHFAAVARASAVASAHTTNPRAIHPLSKPLRSLAPTVTRPYRQHPYSTSAGSATPTPEKPDSLDQAESSIWDLLTAEFAPTELSVQDISGGCGSMYGIQIVSERFRGLNMLKQQRLVNQALGDQIKGWHGVQLRTSVPSLHCD